MTSTELRAAYRNGDYRLKLPFLQRVPVGHIFDEELSVRRNRELVDEHNQRVVEAQRARFEAQAALDRKFSEDSVRVLMTECGLNQRQAERVQAFVYSEWHSCCEDYITMLTEVGDMVSDVLAVQ